MTPVRLSIAHLYRHCDASPDEMQQTHECVSGERRCAYCGVALHPYPCNGCGQFLTAREMHENGSRCDECV